MGRTISFTTTMTAISLEDISSAQINDNGVNVQFTDGGSLTVDGQVATFNVENKNYRADYQNKSWSEA